ncbi:MAG: Spy/CpxP family protein refolding chaperone [Betaproteobacteria bacterium]
MPETSQETQGGRRPVWSRRWFWTAGALLIGAAAVATVAPRAWAFRGMPAHAFAARHGSGGHGGRGARAFGLSMPSDPAAAKQHLAAMSDLVLRGVNATDDQKQRTRQITDRLIDQLGPVVERHHQLHAALVAELAKPQIDRAAIEKLRQDGLALADEASKIALDGVEEIGDVLTPDQRKELIDLGRRLHGHGSMN